MESKLWVIPPCLLVLFSIVAVSGCHVVSLQVQKVMPMVAMGVESVPANVIFAICIVHCYS